MSTIKTTIRLPEQEIEAEVADSPWKKFRGMRFRREGKMLFPFSGETEAPIDMVFVPEKLFLYFIDSDKNVIGTREAPPFGLNPGTWKFYSPGRRYRYLLESFEDLGLEKGDSLEFRV